MTFPPLTPQAIVDKAREFLNTPWHHDARLKGVGIDCIGLIACTFAELGVSVVDTRGYDARDMFADMEAGIALHADLIAEAVSGMGIVEPVADGWAFSDFSQSDANDHILIPGDCLLIRREGGPTPILNHCAIYTGDGCMIHAWNAAAIGEVVEHPIDRFWAESIVAVYRYKGLAV